MHALLVVPAPSPTRAVYFPAPLSGGASVPVDPGGFSGGAGKFGAQRVSSVVSVSRYVGGPP